MPHPIRHAGPHTITALTLMLSGPIGYRELAKALHPLTFGRKVVSSINKGAGAMLGRMTASGWCKFLGEGKYAITTAGREVLARRASDLETDPVVPAGEPVPDGRKRCLRCGRARLHLLFSANRKKPDGKCIICKPCASERGAERRGAIIDSRDAGADWVRCAKPVLIGRVTVLLRVMRQARREGMWRGRSGLKAYAKLGRELAKWESDTDRTLTAEDTVEDGVPDCICPVWPCPRHIESCDPRDTYWNHKAHSNRHNGSG
jgi:hypothetical protein